MRNTIKSNNVVQTWPCRLSKAQQKAALRDVPTFFGQRIDD